MKIILKRGSCEHSNGDDSKLHWIVSKSLWVAMVHVNPHEESKKVRLKNLHRSEREFFDEIKFSSTHFFHDSKTGFEIAFYFHFDFFFSLFGVIRVNSLMYVSFSDHPSLGIWPRFEFICRNLPCINHSCIMLCSPYDLILSEALGKHPWNKW